MASLKLMIFLPHPPSTVIVDCTTTQGINASYLCGLVTPVSVSVHWFPAVRKDRSSCPTGLLERSNIAVVIKGFRPIMGPKQRTNAWAQAAHQCMALSSLPLHGPYAVLRMD